MFDSSGPSSEENKIDRLCDAGDNFALAGLKLVPFFDFNLPCDTSNHIFSSRLCSVAAPR